MRCEGGGTARGKGRRLSTEVWTLVLISAVCHAGWNLYARQVAGHLGVLWLAKLTGLLFLLPLGIWALGWDGGMAMSWRGMGYLALTGTLHSLYFYLLGRTYARGEISVVYPVARGTGVGLTGLGAWLVLGEAVSWLGAMGIASVFGGILLMGIPTWRNRRQVEGLGTALGVGVTILCYSLIDKKGVQVVHPMVYITGTYLLSAAMLAPVVRPKYWGQLGDLARKNPAALLVIGLGSSVTYLLVLYAYRMGPVGYIVAAREAAVVVAVLLGVLVLKEPLSPAKGAAVAVIVLGLLCIRAG